MNAISIFIGQFIFQIEGFENLTYEDRLRKLNLPTVKVAKEMEDLIRIYRILTGR